MTPDRAWLFVISCAAWVVTSWVVLPVACMMAALICGAIAVWCAASAYPNRHAQVHRLVTGGVITPNEARILLGFVAPLGASRAHTLSATPKINFQGGRSDARSGDQHEP